MMLTIHGRVKTLFSRDSSLILHTVTLGVLVVGFLRIALLLTHDPLLAMANNYDMVRIQACHEVWPADSQFAPAAGTIGFPIEEYRRFNSGINTACFPSSEILFSWLHTQLVDDGESFSIRGLAYLKAGLWCVLLLPLIVWLALRSPLSGLVAAVSFSLVLCDPLASLYLPTYYTEFSAVFGFSLSAVLLLLARRLPNSYSVAALLALSLLFLGISRTPHTVLPFLAVVALCIPAWARQTWRSLPMRPLLSALAACIAVVLIQIYWYHADRNSHVRMANSTNTYLYTVLPQAKNPASLAKFLGLPATCAAHAGESWIAIELRAAHPCPEVFDVPRYKILLFPFIDPGAFGRLVANSTESLRPSLVRHIGQVERRLYGRASDHIWSVYSVLDEVPTWLFWILCSAACIPVPGAIASRFFGHIPRSQIEPAWFFVASTAPVVYFVSIAGDGYADLAKHAHLAYLSVGISLTAFSLLTLREVARKVYK